MLSESMKSWDLTGIHVEEVDIDQNRDAAITYGIRGVPTLIIVDENNNVLGRRSGMLSENEFKNWAGSNLLLG
jgi:thiol-disulfide isomerase/thioredoxin